MSGILAAAGGGGLRVTLTNRVITASVNNPDDAYAGIKYLTTGVEQFVQGTSLSWSNIGAWLAAGVNDGLYIRATVEGGTATPNGDSTGTWLALSSDRSWYLDLTFIAELQSDLTIEIARDSLGTDVLDSCSISLIAIVNP